MLHDHSNENVGEANSEKTKKNIVNFLTKKVYHTKCTPLESTQPKMLNKYSLMGKYPILYEIWRGKVVPRNFACRGFLDKLGGKILLTEQIINRINNYYLCYNTIL